MAVRAPRRAGLWRAEDTRLAALAAAGDETAFEAIFERHHRGLLSFARHLLGSPEEAEDVLQHTFGSAYRELVENGPPRHLRAWLYRTTRNRCLDLLRARRELPAERLPASTAGLSEEVERRSDLRELVGDIGRLPEEQRAALVMSEIEDLGHAEVARVLGCPRDKVRALVYQARSSLAGWREARALPCREVRQELSVARGGALRRGHLRRHLNLCPECCAFREDVDRQRRGIALVLPVLPAIGLKERVLEAAWGSAAGGAAAGGSAAGGPAAGGSAAGGSLVPTAIKVGAAVLVLGAGAATVGVTGGEPEQAAPSAGPPPAKSAAKKARPERTKAGSRRQAADRSRERSTAASRDESGSGAASSQSQGVEAPANQPAPTTQAPAAPDVGLPDVEAEVEAEAEVEVQPPAELP
jgi:RNA polymerase sigma factor (sigma-70 family)